jgi:hypothetical protein
MRYCKVDGTSEFLSSNRSKNRSNGVSIVVGSPLSLSANGKKQNRKSKNSRTRFHWFLNYWWHCGKVDDTSGFPSSNTSKHVPELSSNCSWRFFIAAWKVTRTSCLIVGDYPGYLRYLERRVRHSSRAVWRKEALKLLKTQKLNMWTNFIHVFGRL